MSIVYYANIKDVSWNDIERSLHIVSELDKAAIYNLRFEKDRCRTLVGKILLLRILNETTLWKESLLPVFSYNQYRKPLIESSLGLGCFNITHSGDFVACAYTGNGDVGLDVEHIVPVIIDEFREVLTPEEYKLLKSKTDSDFFRLWTVKEAVMKAVGKGFYLDPLSLAIPENMKENFSLIVDGLKLYVENQYLDENYILAIAQSCNKSIELKEIHLK